MNLRFQSSGSSSENRISVPMTPFTRQCATRIAPVVAAGTAIASVTLTSGSLRVTRCEHSACSAAMRRLADGLRDECDGDDQARCGRQEAGFHGGMITGTGGTEETGTERTAATGTEGTERTA